MSTALVTRDTHAEYEDATVQLIVMTMFSTENDDLYQIPKHFEGVSDILDHCDLNVARNQRQDKLT